MEAAVKPRPGKSPLLAVLISLFVYFLPGAGQFYAATFLRGLGFLLGTYAVGVALMAVLMLLPSLPHWLMAPPALAWWVFMAYDARRCALASPPDVEDAAQATAEQAGSGLLPLPSFDAASPALRRGWAATRWATQAAGAAAALAMLLTSLAAVAAGVRAGSFYALVWPLAVLALCGGVLLWLGGRARLVYATAFGAVPLPADKLRGEVRSFLHSACALAGVFGFGVFVTQGLWRDLVRKSNDGATKGNLGALRAAVALAREAESGLPPTDLAELRPRYLAAIPPTKLSLSAFRSLHKQSNAVRIGDAPTDEGGWLYDPSAGTVSVNCTHSDSRLSAWNSY